MLVQELWNLQSLLTILSDVAKAIGAVNTIYKVHRCWDNLDKIIKKNPDTDEAFEERTKAKFVARTLIGRPCHARF
jgi:hypothetical protein